MMTTAIRKNFDSPDQVQTVPDANLDIVKLGDVTAVRSTYMPGWKWSEDVRPIVHTDSCQVRHVGYQISGTLMIKMDDSMETEYGPGDVYDIPPGHDGWVVGDEPVVRVDFQI